MDYVILGRTGLRSSVIGLGAGGHSRLGMSSGGSESDAVALVRRAFELGINFVDTAESYGTEEVVGKAVAGGPREDIIISTKKTVRRDEGVITGEDALRGLEASLRRLGSDYVDVYQLHGVAPSDYERVSAEIVPALEKARDAGKIRFIGITERFGTDPRHETLTRALRDDCWDVFMVGFNILNQTARENVLPGAMRKNIGVLVMFAIREALSRPERLEATIEDLKARGKIDAGVLPDRDPLGFLVREGGGSSVPDAGYRFCRHEQGVHVVLSGTGSAEHLEANVASLLRPPLPEEDVARLRSAFSRVDDVTGD